MAVNAKGRSKDGLPKRATNINLWMQLNEGGPVQLQLSGSEVDGEIEEPNSVDVRWFELPQEARREGDLHGKRSN